MGDHSKRQKKNWKWSCEVSRLKTESHDRRNKKENGNRQDGNGGNRERVVKWYGYVKRTVNNEWPKKICIRMARY